MNRNGGHYSRRSFIEGGFKLGLGIGLNGLLPNTSWQANAQSRVRKDRLIVRSVRPEDLETPIGLLNSWITPNNLFYVRSHLYTPEVELGEWRLSVDGEVRQPLELTMQELRRLPRASVVVTLECAGNGRAFFDPPVAGIQWEKGAVGTARWTGVRLIDVLRRAGLKPTGRWVVFDGADRPIGKVPDFVRNVPIKKALHPDSLLAYEMNGVPIPIPHGFPLRAIVPGWEGAYSVKWVTHVQVTEREHEGFFVKTGYRYPKKRIAPGAAVDPKDMAPLTDLPVKSIITSPIEGATLSGGPISIKGFAWAGEANIVRVEVSVDDGRSWRLARLGREQAPYAWRSFAYDWRPKEAGSYLVMARATDDRMRVQPMAAQWNPSGYLWNVIDRVRVNVS